MAHYRVKKKRQKVTPGHTLLSEISEPTFLNDAWRKLNKSNKHSHGLSTETIEEFQSKLEENISVISQALKKGTYQVQGVRGKLIPKKGKTEYRPLRIGEIRDRLVFKAITIKLDELLTPIYDLDNSASFAYRRNRSVADAIRKMADYYQQGKIYILEADIEKFFDTVDRGLLLKEVFAKLPDSSLNDLITAGLSQEVGNLDEFTTHAHYFEGSDGGIPQGNSLSPLFANIYLSPFDKRMREEGQSLIRYADDFIVMCTDVTQARNALAIAKDELEGKLKLKIHPLGLATDENAKTKIVDPRYHVFSFLSIRFNGTSLWVHAKKVSNLKERIREVTDTAHFHDLITILTKTRNLLEGWLASFKFVDVDRDIESIDDCINEKLFHAFRVLGFGFKEKNIRLIKTRNGEIQCLTSEQRRHSGIKSCSDFLGSIERHKIELVKKNVEMEVA